MITIVTVVLNDVRNIENTIKSVVSIKKMNFNIDYIVVDGLSTDGTIEIIKKYNDCIDLILSETDNGLYDAMNKSIKYAKGEHILYLNSGDTLIVDGFIQALNYLKKGSALICKSKWYAFKNIGFPNKSVSYNLMRMWNHQSMIVPTEYMNDNIFNIEYTIAADLDFKLKLYKSCSYEELEIYIVNCLPGGLSQRKVSFGEFISRINDIFTIAKNHLDHPWKTVAPILHLLWMLRRIKN
jgi:glycosyltransferase involved in cell wall biosynthesis